MKKNPYVIVYGDGGGARGIIPIRILSHLREERKSHFMEGVDCLGGPSTSAIYLSGFNRPSLEDPTKPFWSEEQMEANYRRCCPEIFHLNATGRHIVGKIAALIPTPNKGLIHNTIRSMHKYNPEVLEHFMEKLLGDMKISDGIRSQMIAVKDYRGDNIRFKSLKEDPASDSLSDVPASKAVTASCMHPLCYPSYPMEIGGKKYNFIDGGMFEHPYHVYRMMRRVLPADADIHMIALFSGKENISDCDPDNYDNLGITGLFHHSIKMPVINEFMSGVHAESMNDLRAELGDKLIEVNFDLSRYFPKGAPQVDVATKDIMRVYEDIADDFYANEKDIMRRMKDLLDMREEARYAPEPELEPVLITTAIEPEQSPVRRGWDISALLPSFLKTKTPPTAASMVGVRSSAVHVPEVR